MDEKQKEKALKVLFIFFLIITIIYLLLDLMFKLNLKKHFHTHNYIYRNGLVCPQDYFKNGKLNEFLKYGDIDGINKTEVKNLQNFLRALNYDFEDYELDGVFGLSTKEAVKKFQQNNKIKIDGIIGKETIKVINRSCHKPLKNRD